MEKNMWITNIKLNNFRNYNKKEIKLHENINVFLAKMLKGKPILLNQYFCVVLENHLEQIKKKN